MLPLSIAQCCYGIPEAQMAFGVFGSAVGAIRCMKSAFQSRVPAKCCVSDESLHLG